MNACAIDISCATCEAYENGKSEADARVEEARSWVKQARELYKQQQQQQQQEQGESSQPLEQL